MKIGSLVLYRQRAARVTSMGEKIEIETSDGEILRVRPKDVVILHTGPVASLQSLGATRAVSRELEEALSLIEDGPTSFADLLELCFVRPSPEDAWALYQNLGEYFRGDLDALVPLSSEEREARRRARQEKENRATRMQESLSRLKQRAFQEEDRPLLAEVERFALGKAERCRVLKELAVKETPEEAHRFLLDTGYWSPLNDPWPSRCGIDEREPPSIDGPIQESERRDLTHLPAWAIDDSGNQDPDDALSIDGEDILLHIADPSETVLPDSEWDRAARLRGSTLYLPWTTLPMLHASVVKRYGLGMSDPSPALTLRVTIDPSGEPILRDVFFSFVRVQRRTYEDFEPRWDDEEIRTLRDGLLRYQRRRLERGAVRIQLPEVKIRVRDGVVDIAPLTFNLSRALVAEAMILAGEVMARWSSDQAVPLIYASQEPPDHPLPVGDGPASSWAIKRLMKRAAFTLGPQPHFGLGLAAYCQCTSPLRRYFDLVNHQQIRARLLGGRLLSRSDLEVRLNEAEEAIQRVRKAERLSRTHFTLLWHLQNPGRVHRGTVVDVDRNAAVVVLPATAEEYRLTAPSLELNQEVSIQVRNISLAYQTAAAVLVEGAPSIAELGPPLASAPIPPSQ